MINILDRMTSERSSFRPETTRDYFALQLARKLNDLANVHSYVLLADAYPEDFLIRVYRDTLDKGLGAGMAERFRIELRRRAREEGYEK